LSSTKTWLMIYMLLMLFFAILKVYPLILVFGFLMVVTKLNEIQEFLESRIK